MTTIASLLVSHKNIDFEILLAHVLNVPRSYLHSWPEKQISPENEQQFKHYLQRRLNGEPVAYIIGHQEFWSLDFEVTKDVLIPRPETELLVELVLKFPNEKQLVVADLGTGSGAIALSIANERPQWKIHATDKSEKALFIAKKNADRLKINNVAFYQGDWCEALPDVKFNVIVSNPPYIEENHPNLPALRYEPHTALVSTQQGLADLKMIITQAKNHLQPGGILMLEHGFDQAKSVTDFLHHEGYLDIKTLQDLAGKDRVTVAKRPANSGGGDP